MEDLRYPHLKAVKMILRYVKGTEDLRLFYQKTNIFELAGYVYSDWCGDIDDRKMIRLIYILYSISVLSQKLCISCQFLRIYSVFMSSSRYCCISYCFAGYGMKIKMLT
jgi:hypothetical protein